MSSLAYPEEYVGAFDRRTEEAARLGVAGVDAVEQALVELIRRADLSTIRAAFERVTMASARLRGDEVWVVDGGGRGVSHILSRAQAKRAWLCHQEWAREQDRYNLYRRHRRPPKEAMGTAVCGYESTVFSKRVMRPGDLARPCHGCAERRGVSPRAFYAEGETNED